MRARVPIKIQASFEISIRTRERGLIRANSIAAQTSHARKCPKRRRLGEKASVKKSRARAEPRWRRKKSFSIEGGNESRYAAARGLPSLDPSRGLYAPARARSRNEMRIMIPWAPRRSRLCVRGVSSRDLGLVYISSGSSKFPVLCLYKYCGGACLMQNFAPVE